MLGFPHDTATIHGTVFWSRELTKLLVSISALTLSVVPDFPISSDIFGTSGNIQYNKKAFKGPKPITDIQ